MKRLLVLLIMMGNIPLTHAEDYYISGQADYMRINVANERFNPQISRVKFGVVASESGLFQGIGLETVYGSSIKNDLKDSLDFDVKEHWGVYATFSDYSAGTTNFTIYLGYASTELYNQSLTQNTSI